MKLLIAPWGNPSSWNELFYDFMGVEVKSYTSLKILHEVIKPDKTIIIGLDTLADTGRNYEEVKVNAGKKIRGYANKFGLKEYSVIVAPGIGTFQQGDFRGEALDYYYYVIAKISFDLLKNSEKTLNIHLDLTHGLNYTTILTYRAIKEVLELFSIFKEVAFTAYNADPFSPNAKRLSINVTEDEESIPKPPDEKIRQGRTLEPLDLNHHERRKLFEKELKCIKEVNKSEVSAFLGALYNGLPLALFRFFPQIDKLKEIVLTTMKVYEKYVDVKSNKQLNVTRKVKFGKDFKVYVFAYLIGTLLRKYNLIFCRKNKVTLSEIESLKSKLFSFDERVEVKIDRDIHNIKERIESKIIDNWQVYNVVLGNTLGGVDDRNFLAHSGFEGNAVELRKHNGKLLLRYREEKIRTIAKHCQRGLKS